MALTQVLAKQKPRKHCKCITATTGKGGLQYADESGGYWVFDLVIGGMNSGFK